MAILHGDAGLKAEDDKSFLRKEGNLCWTWFSWGRYWSFSFFPGLMWRARSGCKEGNMSWEYALEGVISLLLLGYLVYALLWPERF
jgi:K+-transporting ATPase KdpF subunit